jgi:signal transduction histidine kinase
MNDVLEKSMGEIKIPDTITVIKRLEPNLPKIFSDKMQLVQCFNNIILNAIQAMPNGGVLTLESFCKNELLEINICDTGAGITKEHLDKIFEPLFSTKTKGVGLGLPICQSIIEAFNGKIEVKSEPEKGTRFIVKLPPFKLEIN